MADPAKLVPADASFYLRIDDLARWLDRRQDDPLIEHAWNVINELQRPAVWDRVRDRLGIDTDELVQRYFGRSLAIVEQKIGEEWAVVVVSRVEPNDLRLLPAAMGASPWTDSPRLGPFRNYRTTSEDADLLLSLGQRWMVLGEVEHAAHLRRLLTAVAQRTAGLESGEPPMVDNVRYLRALEKLPDDSPVVLYTRNNKGDQHHGVAVSEIMPGDSTVHYFGDIAELKDIAERSVTVDGLDFGPLPATVISAVAINVLYHPKDKSEFGKDGEYGSKLAMSVLPELSPPLLIFLAREPSTWLVGAPEVEVPTPVLGVMVKLKSPAAAAKLDSIMRTLHTLVTLIELNVVGTLFGVTQHAEGDVTFSVADFGRGLARRVNDPDLRKLVNLPGDSGLRHVAFGRVGSWYIACSQESYFRRCVHAVNDPSIRLAADTDLKAFSLEDDAGRALLLSSIIRAPRLADLVERTHAYWRHAREDTPESPAADDAPTTSRSPDDRRSNPRDRIDKPLHWIADALKLRRSFSVQVWRDGETGLLGVLRSKGASTTGAD